MDFKQAVARENEALVALRRDLHAHPELGYQEERTASLVEAALKYCGLKEVGRVTRTGVTGLLEGGRPGPVLLLRADMDALPLTEETDLPYASVNPGVMHACGHDGHTAILVTAARILAAHREELAGSVKFVFEPNEEEVGALAMIQAGVMENPRVDAAAGLPLWAPVKCGQMAVDPGGCWAGMDHFRVTVRGRAGHTSAPHQAVDPVLAAAQIIIGAQVLQSRELDPFLASSLLFGRVSGGTAANIIPDQVELEGTLRYLFDGRDDGPYKPRVRFRDLCENIARSFRAQAEVDYYCSQPALINDPGLTRLGRAAAAETLGSESALITCPNLGGEDFSEFSARVPAVFAMVGCGGATVWPHHHPKFQMDEAALAIGLEWLLRVTVLILESSRK
jgi:amidohydrolase